jgi:glycosyltransferase involved in cell wall biosynthesis
MRVLVFTSLYPNRVWPHHGVFVKERITHVAALQRCEVQVVAPVPYFPPLKITRRWLFSQVPRREVIEDLEVYHPRYCMLPKVGMCLHGLLLFVSVLPAIHQLRQRFPFELIDAHYVYPDGLAAVLLGRVFNVPVVVSARGSDINLFTTFPLIRRLLRATLRRADGVIAVSQALNDVIQCLGIPASNVTVIPNGIDTTKFFPVAKEVARAQLGLPGHKILLTVGHLTPVKGFDLLIRAFNRLLAEGQHGSCLSLVIVGEGVLRHRLETLVSSLGLREHVRLVGAVPHEQLYLWYSAADLFCLASSREGWPNVLLEALACGTPVVATAVGGIPEILCSDELGLLTEQSEQDIATTMSLALTKTWRSEAIRRYARKHTWEQVALSVLYLFETILSRQRPVLHDQTAAS